MKTKIIGLILCLIFTSGHDCLAGEDAQLSSLAVKAAKSGSIDVAFMYYRGLLRDHPDSRYKEQALFGMGEYYYQIPDFPKAEEFFNTLIHDFPDTEGMLFAQIHLLKLAEHAKDESLIEELKNTIVTSERVGLIFKDSKEYRYLSPLHREYKAVYYIDKIEFFKDGQLFAALPY